MKDKKKSKVRKTFDLKPKKPLKPKDDFNFKLNEGDIDDILSILGIQKDSELASSIKNGGTKTTIPKATMTAPRVKSYKPRKLAGKRQSGFSDYIRSTNELKSELKDKLGTSKMSLMNVIRLYSEHNLKLDERVVLDYDIKEITKFREYDRTRINGGKLSQDEWDDLMADIKKRGIKNHGLLQIERLKSGDVQVLLGEGNHRLAMAKKLKIKKMPLRISYWP